MASFTIVQDIKGQRRTFTVLVNDKDWADWVSLYAWILSTSDYVVSQSRPQISLHRRIAGVTDRRVYVDHEDGNKMNNRSGNLRPATPQQNAQNNAPKSQYAGKPRPS